MQPRESFARSVKLLMVLADAVLFTGVLWLSTYLRFDGAFHGHTRNTADIASAYVWALIGFIIVSAFSGIYVLYNKTALDLVLITAIDQIIMVGLITSLTFAGQWFAFPRWVIVINFFLSTLVLSAWRVLVYYAYRRVRGNIKVMVLTVPNHDSKAVRNFRSNRSPRHRLTHVVDGNYLQHLREELPHYDSVHVSDRIEPALRQQIIEFALTERKEVFMTADFNRLLMINPTIMSIEDESIVLVNPFRIGGEYDILKRIFDILLSLVLLILTSPLMLIAALAVKLTSPGPVLYRQTRITKNNKPFQILKFRSMTQTAEQESGPVLATTNDARVTKVGKYLRSLRIDELPQLINVLRGDMSIVGPRPERPFFVDQFTELNPRYPLRHNVRAGVTGYAQVYGKYASDFEAKLNFDLLYIQRYTPILDLKIMLQTVKILFDKVSSQGLEDEAAADGPVSLPPDTKVLH